MRYYARHFIQGSHHRRYHREIDGDHTGRRQWEHLEVHHNIVLLVWKFSELLMVLYHGRVTYSHANGTRTFPLDVVHENRTKTSSPVWWDIAWQMTTRLPSSNSVEIFHASAVGMTINTNGKPWSCLAIVEVLTTLVVFSIVSSSKRFTTLIWNISPLYPFMTGPGKVPPASTVLGGSYD